MPRANRYLSAKGWLMAAILILAYPVAQAQFGGWVPIYGSYIMHQGKFNAGATDLHITIKSQENIAMRLHWYTLTIVDASGNPIGPLGGVSTQSLTDIPGVGTQYDIDVQGINVPRCTYVRLDFCLWEARYNLVFVSSKWTSGGSPGDPGPIPPFQWDIRPLMSGGSRLRILNFDTDTLRLKSLRIKYNENQLLPKDLAQWNLWDDSSFNLEVAPGDSLLVSTSSQSAGFYLYFRACWTYNSDPVGFIASELQDDDSGAAYGEHPHYTLPACDNGIDDDGDFLVDMQDPDCCNFGDTSEFTLPPCSDGCDNDFDAHTDHPFDSGCDNPNGFSESPRDTMPTCTALPGDANFSNSWTLGDIIAGVNYVFNKPGQFHSNCVSNTALCWLSDLLCRGDWNASGTVTLADVIGGVNYIFNKPGGPWNARPIGVCCLNPNEI